MQHDVGNVEEFTPGRFKVVTIGSRSIGVVNNGSAFYAVLNVCPHALARICEGGILSGTLLPCEPGQPKYGLEGRILRCPWHHYEFDLDDRGRCVFTSFRGRLRLFPVTVEHGKVFVEVKERRQANARSV